MVAHRTPKNEPHAHTSRTLFRKDFARTRTRATTHRTCACAHAPSQLIPWLKPTQVLKTFLTFITLVQVTISAHFD